jgi:hypothetical protein
MEAAFVGYQPNKEKNMKPNWIRAALLAVLSLACALAQAGVIASDSTYGVFDRSAGSRVFNVTGHGMVNDVNITIDFSKCDDPPIGPNGNRCIGTGSGFPGEIEFRLMGSDGRTVVNLVNEGTYTSGAGRFTVTFDDEAGAGVGGRLASGSYRPVGALAAFDGMDMFGSWSLLIRDARGGDPLEYFSSTLEIGEAPVPEPANPGILGIGMLGMWAARRRVARRRNE